MKNQLAKVVDKLNKKPSWFRYRLLSLVLGKTVKFVGTAGVKCIDLSADRSIFMIKNKSKVRNHIGTLHAAASMLVAETATGMALGMHVPDNKIPVLKNVTIDYVKRSTGSLRAEASLTEEQKTLLHSDDRGSFIVKCEVIDEANIEPIIANFEWAWTPKRK
ncbi:MAG: acyl-coenzyme A thioesterase PaaI-like protein [Polaribacter sp.]|jgi:acyl-coenzyme A thioesterase PaaI-like protein